MPETMTTSQAATKAREFLHLFRAVNHIGEVLETASRTEAQASELQSRLDGLRKQIADTETKAKTDADAREAKDAAAAAAAQSAADKANEIMSTAKAKAADIANEAKEKANATTKKAGERAVKLEAEVAVLSEILKAKSSEIAILDERIAKARETIRSFGAL